MVLARLKVWVTGEVLTAADFNAEIDNILDNANPLISPYTAAVDANLKETTNLVIERVGALPGTATAGRVIQLTTDDIIYAGDGTNWNAVGEGTHLTGIYNHIKNDGLERWPDGTTSAPDGWVLEGGGASVAREGTIVNGGTYSAKLTRSGTDCNLNSDLAADITGSHYALAYYKGKAVIFEADVYATAANAVKLSINDGVSATASSFHTGGSSWERLSVSKTLDANSTVVEVRLEVVTSDTSGYIDNAILVEGSRTPKYAPRAGDFNQPRTGAIEFIIDGGGNVIATGEKGHLEIPFDCNITQVTTLADTSGSIVVDIWKDTYANFPPTNADSITASAPPTLSSAQKSQDTTLTGWTTKISAGDVLAYNVDSSTTVTRVIVSLEIEKL